jgi:hypothetical protein
MSPFVLYEQLTRANKEQSTKYKALIVRLF